MCALDPVWQVIRTDESTNPVSLRRSWLKNFIKCCHGNTTSRKWSNISLFTFYFCISVNSLKCSSARGLALLQAKARLGKAYVLTTTCTTSVASWPVLNGFQIDLVHQKSGTTHRSLKKTHKQTVLKKTFISHINIVPIKICSFYLKHVSVP